MKKKILKLPTVSIIIPTYNRSKILKKSLHHFTKQNYPKHLLEIVIIDDGSKDNTKKTVNVFKKQTNKTIKTTYLYQKNKGPAAARNLGIKKCQGSIVIIVNDDILAIKDFVSQHIRFHQLFPKNNFAVLGYTTWSKTIKRTPFMTWLETRGPLFSYNGLTSTHASWGQAWTCNISYKKEFLLKNGLFDEDFPFAAWEDIELGYRLHQKGMKLKYNRKAIGFHVHPTTLKSSIKKMKHQGISVVILGQKIQNKSVLPPLAKKDLGGMIDLIDRIVFNPFLLLVIRKLAFYSELRFINHYIYEYLLLHYRVVARRNYLKSIK
ncbi:glycosyltransferase family 2 protein [Patescibacteria group bacterium]